MNSQKLKIGDRVKRLNLPGCFGVVQDIRTEVTSTTPEVKEKGLMIHVLWDNGTLSCFGPEALEVVKE